MKKIILFAAGMLLSFGLFAGEMKIAVVDVDMLFQKYYKTKIVDATLKQQMQVYQAWLKKLNDSMVKLQQEFNLLRDDSQNIALSAAEREHKRLEAEKKYRQMKEKRAEIEQYSMDKSRQYKQVEENKRKEIIEEIQKTIAARAALEGYTLVLDKSGKTFNGISGVIYYKPSMDITEDILKELNRGHDKKKSDSDNQ
jgi:Skp family chaperone for outer membrane proteins